MKTFTILHRSVTGPRIPGMAGVFTSAFVAAGLVWSSANGATVPVPTRAGVSGTDFIDWGTLGPEFTAIPNPGVVLSNGGLSVDLMKPAPQGGFEIAEEGGASWLGNFAVGDSLLWLAAEPGGLLLDFSSAIGAAGAQIQMDFYDTFHVTLMAYDASSTLLGTHHFSGISTPDQDNSAIFAGLASDSLNIDKLEFLVFDAAGAPMSFAINRVEIGGIRDAVIPESSTWVSGGAIAIGMVVAGLRARRRNV